VGKLLAGAVSGLAPPIALARTPRRRVEGEALAFSG
jgi:hypothetical protein